MVEYYLAIKWNSDICYNMEEAWGHYAKWNETGKKDKYCIILLCELPTISKFIKTESRIVVTMG